jgi:hypothetical protein
MGWNPTVQPTVSGVDLQDEPQRFDADVEEPRELAADDLASAVDKVQLKTKVRAQGGVKHEENDPSLSSITAVLMGDCPTFINTLSRAVESEITPAMLRKLQRAARFASDEAATFERLALVAIDDTKPSAAAKICAALAARTAGRLVRRANGDLDPADAAELFTAWLETARAMIAARGFAGLHRLLPAAKLLACRSAERGDSAAEIATTMHRIATRILAELSLERTFNLATLEQEPDTVSPRGAVSHSPAEMILHPR